MLSTALPFALLALVPVLIGPPPQQPTAMIVELCNGGTVTIPLGDDAPTPDRNCHPKGCHAGTCRDDRNRDQSRRTQNA
jgi:hypothetical protein